MTKLPCYNTFGGSRGTTYGGLLSSRTRSHRRQGSRVSGSAAFRASEAAALGLPSKRVAAAIATSRSQQMESAVSAGSGEAELGAVFRSF